MAAAFGWAVKIGYKLNDDGQRIRAYHYLERNQTEAMRKAIALQPDWERIAGLWPRRRAETATPVQALAEEAESLQSLSRAVQSGLQDLEQPVWGASPSRR